MKVRMFFILPVILFLAAAFGCGKAASMIDTPPDNTVIVSSPTPSESSEEPPPPEPPKSPRPHPPILHNKEKKDDELITAVKDGDYEQVKQLLENEANPNSFYKASETSDYYVTALGLSVEKKNTKIAELLLEHGADVNKHSFDADYTFLSPVLNFGWAVGNEDLPMMNLLAAHNADLQLSSDKPYLVKNEQVLDFLVKKGYDINARDIEGRTVLIEAVFSHNFDLVKAILRYKPNLNLRTEALKVTDYKKMTALELANAYGDKEIVQALKKAGEKLTYKVNKIFLTK